VDAIIINDSQTDIYNPNVIRASEGLVFANQIAIASKEDTKDWLEKNKIESLAAATKQSTSYLKENFSKPVAIVLGSEAKGLSDYWLKTTKKRINIPMKKGIDSLNVSVSAAVIIFEALRQRNIK
jgi:TrmH family RNA methyltransferase